MMRWTLGLLSASPRNSSVMWGFSSEETFHVGSSSAGRATMTRLLLVLNLPGDFDYRLEVSRDDADAITALSSSTSCGTVGIGSSASPTAAVVATGSTGSAQG